MQNISLRKATTDDAAFALHVTEACMRVYAERTWGTWNGLPDFDPPDRINIRPDTDRVALRNDRLAICKWRIR
jgi:hypothetical protein